MTRDWEAFNAALRGRVPELAAELLGRPTIRAGNEWRWGRKGSLSVVIDGAKAGIWFDHEAGKGGGFADLVAHTLGISRTAAFDWIADRIGMAARGDAPQFRDDHRARSGRESAAQLLPQPGTPQIKTPTEQPQASNTNDNIAIAAAGPSRADKAALRARRIWDEAEPASPDHPYLSRKGVSAHGLRCDASGKLIIPLQDGHGKLHSLEFIAADGAKRFLAGGAKRGHFTVIGEVPASLVQPDGPLLICEGWATGASLAMATGHSVIAAMDAGNLLPVATALRQQWPDADLVIVADNDARPDRDSNPGVEAARKAAMAVDARLAVPVTPGDANDLFCIDGAPALANLIADAAKIAPSPPTYPAPVLSANEARSGLSDAISGFMADVCDYWATIADEEDNQDQDETTADFNLIVPAILPPHLGLPIDVGLGKTSAARTAIAELIASGSLGRRKIIYAVPRHDLGAEQVDAFAALGLDAMLWKGRTAPDPTPDNPDQLMCLDPEATFDALMVEQAVEQSVCKVKRKGTHHKCPFYESCSYQGQKPAARSAQIIVCAHDSLFHAKPSAIGKVGLVIIDEGFWQSGLRGIDGKVLLTEDSIEPDIASLTCYDLRGRIDYEATNDLLVARTKLQKALNACHREPLSHGLLVACGLTAKECRHAAGLERTRLRDPKLLPGMDAATRASKIKKVLPPHGIPWAPPGRAATMWSILARALDGEYDAGGVQLVNEPTENGTVRALKLRWRTPLRAGWTGKAPILHLDATLQPYLVAPYLPRMDIGAPIAARQPHMRVRQITGSPTSARALSPDDNAPERDHKHAAANLRDLGAWIALRARERHGTGAEIDLLVVGQKHAIDALRSAGLPPRVEAVHFNALSGLDRWGDIGAMIVIGRTLPAPRTVELIAAALTGHVHSSNLEAAGWWYPMADRYLRLANGKTAPLAMEAHDDPIAEAVRWSICEGELIQAIGRGRGVNRGPGTVLEVDLISDAILPVTVDELVSWSGVKPTRHDLMALTGIVLENAADMAACFPDLWPTHQAARQDRSRSVTNCYYKTLYNSKMSHSSAEVTYRPAGAGHRARNARVDLFLIPDPQSWLTIRLGPLAMFQRKLLPIAHAGMAGTEKAEPTENVSAHHLAQPDAEKLDLLAAHLRSSLKTSFSSRRATLNALAARLEAAAPGKTQKPSPHTNRR